MLRSNAPRAPDVISSSAVSVRINNDDDDALADAAVRENLLDTVYARSGADGDAEAEEEAGGRETLLHVAARRGRHDLIQHLALDAMVDARDASGWTALMTAIDLGDVRTAAALIRAGADVNLLCMRRYDCLSCAVVLFAQEPERREREEMIRLLVASGAAVDAHHVETGETPLHLATRFECVDAMETLLTLEADVSVVDKDEHTIVDVAVANGSLSLLQWLDEHALTRDFERQHAQKRSPLVAAVATGRLDIVAFLVASHDRRIRASGAAAHPDAEARVRVHRSEALYAALLSRQFDMVDFLCAHGADASLIGDAVGSRHTTSLHIAVKYGTLDIAEFLIERQHADVNYRNQRGRTPLHVAVIEGHGDMVKLLLMHGADVDALSASRIQLAAHHPMDRMNALELAIWHDHYGVAGLLAQHGASVYDVDCAELRFDKLLGITDADVHRSVLEQEGRLVAAQH